MGQLRVSIGDNPGGPAPHLVVTERLHACPEYHEIGVDVVGLAEPVASAVRPGGPLTPSQVHQGQLRYRQQ